MAQEEIFGTRDRSYSEWHRRLSTGRFVGIEVAQTLSMIDLDATLYVECEDKWFEPLALIETAIDRGQSVKPASMTRNLARRVRPPIEAFCVLYTLSNMPNPANQEYMDISQFRVKRIWPWPETRWVTLSPKEWAEALVRLRVRTSAELDKVIFPDAAA